LAGWCNSALPGDDRTHKDDDVAWLPGGEFSFLLLLVCQDHSGADPRWRVPPRPRRGTVPATPDDPSSKSNFTFAPGRSQATCLGRGTGPSDATTGRLVLIRHPGRPGVPDRLNCAVAWVRSARRRQAPAAGLVPRGVRVRRHPSRKEGFLPRTSPGAGV